HIRIVTAGSLFDGHDAAINIMRRIIQASGGEVIHLGHNRSVQEIVDCAIQEDVQAVAITSYQGGHMEFFKYIFDSFQERGASHIKIFGGGGGTILPEEIKELETYGISRIYSPEDGMQMGLQGMINDLLKQVDFPLGLDMELPVSIHTGDKKSIARWISALENFPNENTDLLKKIKAASSVGNTPILGVTGTGGAGKSTLTDELVRRFLSDFSEQGLDKS